MNFAVDTGGTFTDLILDTGSELRMFKAPTTPEDPAEGVLSVFALAAEAMCLSRAELLGAGDLLVHGTTHAINALVTGTTARTAFLTTPGHPDILLFREGGRRDPFDFSVPYPEPLAPRAQAGSAEHLRPASNTVPPAASSISCRRATASSSLRPESPGGSRAPPRSSTGVVAGHSSRFRVTVRSG